MSSRTQNELVVVPESGHNMNLQRNADVAFDAILAWLDERFPPLGL